MGYTVLGMPVFLDSSQYLKKNSEEASNLTRDYIKNSSLLINLSKAIGRILVSYKDIQNLAGYTYLIYDMEEVLNDLQTGNYIRKTVESSNFDQQNMSSQSLQENLNKLSRGQYIDSTVIRFEDVPIISPNGDVLVDKMNITIKPGLNCIISGPNGCGKSSLFRILGQLWPLFGGKVYRPNINKLFYIPQRPYLPNGTLLDQVIYPHITLKDGITSDDIIKLLRDVQLGALSIKDDGLNTKCDWKEVLSGGEKQRIAMARLFYHKPEFAILDECTSTINLDVEHLLYTKARDLNITLFTISHRPS